MRRTLVLVLGVVCSYLPAPSAAATIVIDFETIADGDAVASQLPGLTFSNAIGLTSGISLNEFEYPPRSGATVASDSGGSINIAFDGPVSNVGGYFTYAVPLTLQAFDTSNALLGSISSAFLSNVALSGDAGSAPNEPLFLAFAGISSVVITGDPLGGSFVVDDLTYDSTTSVPDQSSTIVLLLIAGGAGFLRFRHRRGQS